MKKIVLYGRHSVRTPMAYSCYRKLFSRYCEYLEAPEEADVLVVGFVQDIRENLATIATLQTRNPLTRVVVLSEEPLWDTLWSGEFWIRNGAAQGRTHLVSYEFLNHCTTQCYQWERFPYYITTSDDYFVRYANLFRRNALLRAEELLDIWKKAPIRQAYFAERRLTHGRGLSFPDHDILGLSAFRTELALAAGDDGVLRVGFGWGESTRRQALPDWHLDKLARLDRQVYVMSGIENTHHPQYVTEKVFDAFAVLGVPLYVASENHSLNRLIPEGAFINLFGHTPREASKIVRDFVPDRAYVEKYRECQSRLAGLFSDVRGYVSERSRVVAAVVAEMRLLW